MDFDLPEEHSAFRDVIRRWVENECPKDWARELEADEDNYPHALWDKFTEAGMHGVGIDEEFGGQGGDVLMQMVLARELARSLGGLAWIWGITSFAGSKSIGLYGTAEQKARYLPKIAAGELKAAISFTEPGGGTDLLGSMATTAERVDGGWVINGEKIWSSSAHVADYLLCIARSDKNVLKLQASEAANHAADLGIQILGGMGYSAETDMQRYWRDSRLWRIGPITNEMVKNGIAQSLGLPRSY
jgi:acyl-CoA dehydrogenase